MFDTWSVVVWVASLCLHRLSLAQNTMDQLNLHCFMQIGSIQEKTRYYSNNMLQPKVCGKLDGEKAYLKFNEGECDERERERRSESVCCG